MLRVTLSPEIAETLKAIYEAKARIASRPTPSEDELQAMEREFLTETAYHAVRLSQP